MHMRKVTLWIVVGIALFCCTAVGQEKVPQTPVRSSGYDLKREGTLVGTVVAYTQSSTTPPLGAHVTLQTTGGVVDVHLGDARLLTANNFNIHTGDTLRIIGENVAFGSAAPFLRELCRRAHRRWQFAVSAASRFVTWRRKIALKASRRAVCCEAPPLACISVVRCGSLRLRRRRLDHSCADSGRWLLREQLERSIRIFDERPGPQWRVPCSHRELLR